VTTSGDQNYRSAAVLGADDSLTGNSISFASTIGGARGLTTNSAVDTTFGGAVSIGALDATAGGKINLNAGTIATTGDQTYRTDAQLLADNGLSAGGAIDFMGAVGGNSKLTTNSTGDTTFGGVVNVGSLDATAAHVNLNNGAVTTAQDQSYAGAVVLGADSTLTSGGNIALNGTVGGAGRLTTSSTGDTTFGGAVNIGALDATAGGKINLNAGTIATSGDQIYRTDAQLLADNG